MKMIDSKKQQYEISEFFVLFYEDKNIVINFEKPFNVKFMLKFIKKRAI